MDFLPEDLDDYVVAHSQKEPLLLQELNRETWQKVLAPRMLSGHFQGRLLAMISKLVQPNNILEIGTYTGYSALCLCEGLSNQGKLHTIDNNEELVSLQKKYFKKAGLESQIQTHTGNALDIIPNLNLKFDLVFIDADKSNYPNYFNLVIDKMEKGGVILTDNVLWSGKVIKDVDPKDQDTKALIAYNKLINEDKRLETILLPIRDGLTLSRVKP